ncbi:MAG: metal-sulfur cluster assembly factor [Candidatus Micrarchaeota archaeon]
MLTNESVMSALLTVEDPEIAMNIVDLGLVYEVKLNKDDVDIKMTLTTPMCPLLGQLLADIQTKVKEAGAKEVNVELVWDPPWTPEKMSEKAKAMLGIF